MNKNNSLIFKRKTAFMLSVVIGTIIMIVMLLSYFRARIAYGSDSVSTLFTLGTGLTFLFNVLFLYLLFVFQFSIVRSHMPPKKKTLVIILGSLLILLVLSPVFSNIHWWIISDHISTNIFLIIFFIKDTVLLIISLLFTALLYSWTQTQKALLENRELMLENVKNRYDALKSQVDPHFLFNSLNTLNGLIGLDDDKARDYVAQLSSVFRYTMQNKPVMLLADEIEFAESYTYLMKIRYGDSLHIEYNIDDKYSGYYIIPFGLQLLLENAIKHNIITNKRPLTLIIETTDNDTIRVKNNLQPKPEQKHGGVGLTNLNERYMLMFGKEIVISQTNDYFIVEIPLIKQYESSYSRR